MKVKQGKKRALVIFKDTPEIKPMGSSSDETFSLICWLMGLSSKITNFTTLSPRFNFISKKGV